VVFGCLFVTKRGERKKKSTKGNWRLGWMENGGAGDTAIGGQRTEGETTNDEKRRATEATKATNGKRLTANDNRQATKATERR